MCGSGRYQLTKFIRMFPCMRRNSQFVQPLVLTSWPARAGHSWGAQALSSFFFFFLVVKSIKFTILRPSFLLGCHIVGPLESLPFISSPFSTLRAPSESTLWFPEWASSRPSRTQWLSLLVPVSKCYSPCLLHRIVQSSDCFMLFYLFTCFCMFSPTRLLLPGGQKLHFTLSLPSSLSQCFIHNRYWIILRYLWILSTFDDVADVTGLS